MALLSRLSSDATTEDNGSVSTNTAIAAESTIVAFDDNATGATTATVDDGIVVDDTVSTNSAVLDMAG